MICSWSYSASSFLHLYTYWKMEKKLNFLQSLILLLFVLSNSRCGSLVRFKRASGFLEGPLPLPANHQSQETNEQTNNSTNSQAALGDGTSSDFCEASPAVSVSVSQQNGSGEAGSLWREGISNGIWNGRSPFTPSWAQLKETADKSEISSLI